MTRLHSATLTEAVERAHHSDSRLVLIVGESPDAIDEAGASAASALAWPLVDLNVALGERLLPYTPSERREEAWDAFAAVLGRPSPGLVVVGTDILFEPALDYRPYEALRWAGRRGPVVATWLGHIEGPDIIRSQPGHPEYVRVRLDVPFVAVGTEGVDR